MKVSSISKRLVELLKEKRFVEAQQELFHENTVSLEPGFHPKTTTEGLANIIKKEKAFLKHIRSWDVYSVSEPVVSQNHFCVHMYAKLCLHNSEKLEMDELILYEVTGNKITSEQFFYKSPSFN